MGEGLRSGGLQISFGVSMNRVGGGRVEIEDETERVGEGGERGCGEKIVGRS